MFEQALVNKMSALTAGFGFDVFPQAPGGDVSWVGLIEAGTQQWFMVCEFQILQFPWHVLAEIFSFYQNDLGDLAKLQKPTLYYSPLLLQSSS